MRGYARGRDAEPVRPLQRRLPLRRSCSRSRGAPAPRAWRPATTRAPSRIAAACCSRARRTARRTSPTCSPRSTRRRSIGSGSRSASARRPRRARAPQRPASPPPRAPRARRRASSPATTSARSSSVTGSRAEEGTIADEAGRHARPAPRRLALHARPAPRPRRGGRGAALRAPRGHVHEHRRRRAARGARPAPRLRARPPARRRSSGPRSKLRYRSPAVAARGRRRPPAASGSRSTSRPTASRRGRLRCSTRTTSWWAPDGSSRRARRIVARGRPQRPRPPRRSPHTMTDEIRLTLPRERPFYGIAHLVLGGLAVRLDLTVRDARGPPARAREPARRGGGRRRAHASASASTATSCARRSGRSPRRSSRGSARTQAPRS